ncbi:hypothetical protein ISR94_01860 [Candidatus Microgenomates bacterium]|nr:hypothetical protein [Candidatus Microgenomates bacterium]
MYSPRYITRLIQAFFKRFKAIIFFSIFVGAVFFLILNLILPSIIAKSVEKIGISGKYSTDNLPEEILTLISDGLTTVDENGAVTPNLASSWESLDGGKTWIFTLDTTKTWQDGKNISTESVVYEFTDAQVNIIDEKTIEFKLQTPFSAFPVVVSKPVFKKGLLGTGEWKVKKVSLIGGYVNKLTMQDSLGNKKIFSFYPTESRLKLGFKLGEVSTLQNLFNPKPFDEWKTTEVQKNVSTNHFVGIFFNTLDELLSEKIVRQALNYATDKNNFDTTRALGPISPTSWGYNPQVKPYTQDIERAKELLNSDEEIKIVLSTSSSLLPQAEKIKDDWQKIGVTAQIQVVSGVPQNYQAFLATVDIPKDPDQYVLWHSTQQTNISKYQNPRIDKLLEDGRIEQDLETRKKIYLDFQRFLVEDSPAIFLYHPSFYTVTRK